MNKKYLEYMLGSACMIGIGYFVSTPIYAQEADNILVQVEEEFVIEQEVTESDDVIDIHDATFEYYDENGELLENPRHNSSREIFSQCGLDYDKFLGNSVDVEYIKSVADENGYVIRDGILFGYVGEETNLNLSNEIKGIIEKAFANSKVVSIVFPENLSNYDQYILKGCSYLQSVYIPSSSYANYEVPFGTTFLDTKFPYIVYTDASQDDENWNATWDQRRYSEFYLNPIFEYNRSLDFYEKWRDFKFYEEKNGNVDINIPSYIELTPYRLNKWVQSNSEYFRDASFGTLTIPGTYPTIGENALGQINVNKIVIKDGIKTISNLGLWNVNANEIVLPSTLEKIGDLAFSKTVKVITFNNQFDLKNMGNQYTGFENLVRVNYPGELPSSYYWVWNISTHSYTNQNIQFYNTESHFMILNGNRYYILENGEYAKGWMKIEDEWYYFDEDGIAVEGWQEIDDEWYFFDEDGIMQTGWYADEDNETIYYLGDDGARRTGIIEVDGVTYQFNDDGELIRIVE